MCRFQVIHTEGSGLSEGQIIIISSSETIRGKQNYFRPVSIKVGFCLNFIRCNQLLALSWHMTDYILMELKDRNYISLTWDQPSKYTHLPIPEVSSLIKKGLIADIMQIILLLMARSTFQFYHTRVQEIKDVGKDDENFTRASFIFFTADLVEDPASCTATLLLLLGPCAWVLTHGSVDKIQH